MRVRIFQLPENDPRLFRSFDETVKGEGFDRDEYKEVWSGLAQDDWSLEHIFDLFNGDGIPENYTGRSLSVSDLVEITKNGKTETYFCEPFGWQKV